MKIIRILAIISGILILLCLAGVITLSLLPEIPHVPDDSDDDKPVNNPSVDDVILLPTEDAGQEYIDKIYFIGDSTTYHFKKAGIDTSHLLVPPGEYTLKLGSDILDVVVNLEGETITEALTSTNAEIVIITLGVNGAASFTELQYKTYYKKLINGIKEESPDTTIILQSVFPIVILSHTQHGITNEKIDLINTWVKEIAYDTGVRYLDTQSILKNSVGSLIESYCDDEEMGIHMGQEAYLKILEYIRTHSIYE